jgi:methionine synthase II (cobalamin-independent)
LSDDIFRLHESAKPRRRYKLRSGLSVDDIRFDNLFYADIAKDSYAIFKELKEAGKIPVGTRFQVDLVPAHSVIWLFLVDELHSAIDPIFNRALKNEIHKIAAAIPHGELAIQFDVASAVFARLERAQANNYGRTKAEMQETFSDILIDLGNEVPRDVELMYHLCYGDSNHRHVIEPTDMTDMIEFTNRVCGGLDRMVDLVHMPVPRDRSDDAYFAPLRQLQLQPGTELCLGLVHYTDGVAGAKNRLDTARKYASSFSIATECGFGRRPPETIPALLRLHNAVADLD